MSIVLVLIPLGILLVAAAAWAFLWAVNHDQFDDLESPAYRILFDDDEPPPSDPPAPGEDS